MTFYGLKRRGLRAIITREEIEGRRLRLTLECGHIVVRGNHGIDRASTKAQCAECKRTDGIARDAATAKPATEHPVIAAPPPTVRVTLPMKVVNESNRRGHWSERAKRTKQSRSTIGAVLAAHVRAAGSGLRLPLVVTLTRIAPRNLDSDGVVSAMKACRDGVADALGVDDGDERIEWRYGQRRSGPGDVTLVRGYGVEVRIEART